MYNPYSLEGKTILITGASSGIGRATAVESSKMGAKLILTGRDEARLLETFQQTEGSGHEYIAADLTIDAEREKLLSAVENLDGLVLCAGKTVTTPILFSSPEKFGNLFKVNFFSPVELFRLLSKQKKIQTGASLVFVSSTSGIRKYNYGAAIYGASKAAFSSVMKFCAREFAPKDIRVNSVNPGKVKTKMIEGNLLTQEQVDADIKEYPLQRYGEPEEIAYAIIFLLSDASKWITGLELIIDGGYTI